MKERRKTECMTQGDREVADFFWKMHAKDYFDQEASLEIYLEWKPMVETRKLLFVKLKLKSMHFNGGRGLKSNGLDKVSQRSVYGTWEHI